MPRVTISWFLLAWAISASAQQRSAEPPLPPPAVVSVSVPNLSGLQPFDGPDGEMQKWKVGRAVVDVTIDYYGAASFDVLPDGNPAVDEIALSSLKRWKFAKYQPGKIEIVYVIKVAGSATRGAGNAKVELDLPNRVTITVSPSRPLIIHAPPLAPPPPRVLVPCATGACE